MKFWLPDLVAKIMLLVTFLQSALGCQSSQCLSFGFIQRQEGKTKIINFDDESTIVINFRIPKICCVLFSSPKENCLSRVNGIHKIFSPWNEPF